MAGKIEIDKQGCKGCGLCIEACPQKCITISTKTNTTGYFYARASNIGCTGCAICALLCPEVAITVYRDPVQEINETSNRKPAITRGK